MTADDLLQERAIFFTDNREDFTLGAFSQSGELIGTVSFSQYPLEKMRHKGRLFGMYVAKEGSGRGLGRALLQAALRRAGENPSIEQIDLECVASNLRARQLYESEGFEAFSLERDATKSGEDFQDEVRMALKLKKIR